MKNQIFVVPSTDDITEASACKNNQNPFRRWHESHLEEKVQGLETLVKAMLNLMTDQQRYDLFIKINGPSDPEDFKIFVNAPVSEE